MTKALRCTVAFGAPEEGTEQGLYEAAYGQVSAPPAATGRERSSTISEGMSPNIPCLDVHSPLPPPRVSSQRAASAAARPTRTCSSDADLSALQRLFPEDSEYRVAAPGRSLLWEGRCTCLCASTGTSTLRPARPPQLLERSCLHSQDVMLPDYHLLLFNDALVWARRSAGTISSPHRPIEFRVLRTVKVRQGFERDSTVIGHLDTGTTVIVVERRENDLGQVRARIATGFGCAGCGGGWVSIATEQGEELLAPLWLDIQCSFEEEGELGLVLGELPPDLTASSDPHATSNDRRIVLLGVTHSSHAASKPELLELCEQQKPAELVSVQGTNIVGKTFEQVLELLSDAARPLCLVFKYQPAADITADCRVATLNHLRPQALTYEHSLMLKPQTTDVEHNEQNGGNSGCGLHLERYPDTVVAGRYLSRLFAIRERICEPRPTDNSDGCGDGQLGQAVIRTEMPHEYRWWIISLFEQDETEDLIAKLAAQLHPGSQRVASANSPELFPYGFLTPRHRPLTKQQQSQVILDASTVLHYRTCDRRLQWVHDKHGQSVFIAQEVLSESGSTQTRTVSVQFSATEGVVTAAASEAESSIAGRAPAHRTDISNDEDVIVGIFPMECIRAFECNSTKTVFRLYFHRQTGIREHSSSDSHGDSENTGKRPCSAHPIHGLDVDSVYFKTDQAEGMRQAMAMAWSEAKSNSIEREAEEQEDKRKRQREKLRRSSESNKSSSLIAVAFSAWRTEALNKRCENHARPSRDLLQLKPPESPDAAALYIQVVQVRPLPWSTSKLSTIHGSRHGHNCDETKRGSGSVITDADFDATPSRFQYQLQFGSRFAQSSLSTSETWKSPHIFMASMSTAKAVDADTDSVPQAEVDRHLHVHLCHCYADSDNAPGCSSSLLDERCGTATIDLSAVLTPAGNSPGGKSVDAIDDWALVRAAASPANREADLSGVAVAMVRVSVLRVTQVNYVQLKARGITCAYDYLAEQASHGEPLRDQHGFLFRGDARSSDEDTATTRLAWRSLQNYQRSIDIAHEEQWARQIKAVDERLRQQIWHGVATGHRGSVWAEFVGANRLRAAHSPVWYDECLEVSAASVVHLPAAEPAQARSHTAHIEQEFAGLCAFIRTVSLPQRVLRTHRTDLCRRVLLAFCAHAHRKRTSEVTGQRLTTVKDRRLKEPVCKILTKERMQTCISAMASAISFIQSSTASSEEETFWLFVPLAESGIFYSDDARTVADLRMIDTALMQHAPELRAHLVQLGSSSDSGRADTDCASFVFREMYQPLLTCMSTVCSDDADLGMSRLWDVILLEGRVALCASIIALLGCSAGTLLSSSATATTCSSAGVGDGVNGEEDSRASKAAQQLRKHCSENLLQNADALLLCSSSSSGNTRASARPPPSHFNMGILELVASLREHQVKRTSGSDQHVECKQTILDGGGGALRRFQDSSADADEWQEADVGHQPRNRLVGGDEANIFLDFAAQFERQREAAWMQRKHTHLRKIEKAAREDHEKATVAVAQAAEEVRRLQLEREVEMACAAKEMAAATEAGRREKRAASVALSLELELRSLRLLATQQDRARSLGSARQHQQHQQAACLPRRSSSAEDF